MTEEQDRLEVEYMQHSNRLVLRRPNGGFVIDINKVVCARMKRDTLLVWFDGVQEAQEFSIPTDSDELRNCILNSIGGG